MRLLISEQATSFVPIDSVTAHISGIVFDADTAVPLPGVEVKVRGIQTIALTAAGGGFALPVPGRGQWTLFFKRQNLYYSTTGYLHASRRGCRHGFGRVAALG